MTFVISVLSAGATATIAGAGGLTVSVDPSGWYAVAAGTPSWTFHGATGTSLSNISVGAGSDANGPYSEIAFDFQTGVPRHATIRAWWNRRSVLFTLNFPAAAPNGFAFPSFSQYPQGLSHINFSGNFAAPSFSIFEAASPWVFFDSAANTFVLSPAANFMTATTGNGPNGELTSGISSNIASIPQGFTQRALLVMEAGINRAFDTWGQTLTALAGKMRPANDADATLNRLGYWTDAGSTYYYGTESKLTYADTLAAVKADFDAQGIPLGYLQLDSWFYPKGAAADWTDRADGIYQYSAAPVLFGSSLGDFQRALGIPLVTHARWIDTSSPYRQQYQFSGDVATDPRYWSDTAQYLKNSGAGVYEQDWLSDRAQTNFNLTDPDAFLDNMAAGMAQQGITLQYCMPTVRHFLEGSKYGNLTSIRASMDRFDRTHWTNFLYASRLAGALGIWPFTDVFLSTEPDNLLLATLSAGPVGIGDAIGKANTGNLLRAVRGDGVIVKPDVPLVPLDSSYLSDAQTLNAPLIASTYTDFGGLRAYYIFAYNQGPNLLATFTLADLGMNQPAYVYDYFEGDGQVALPGDTINEPIEGTLSYLVVSPIGKSGMAILGDTGQFVSLGKKRVTALSDDGTVHLTVVFASGETWRSIRGYSPTKPVVKAENGALGRFEYDPSTRLFSIALMAGADGTASIDIAAPAASLATVAPGHPRRPEPRR